MKYRKGYKYQLAADETFQTEIKPGQDIICKFIELYRDGRLVVKEGYAWDGPSGPTIDRKSNMRGSLGHDALYQLMRERRIPVAWRSKADDMICACWIEDGMFPWLARMETKALRDFADYAANPKYDRKVHEAP